VSLIVIVDDRPDARYMLSRLLERCGHETEAYDNGEECLARLTRDPLPGLVILDHMMPGASGLEVLRIVREEPRTSNVPVVIFSAVQDDGFRKKAMAEGAAAVWLKGSFDFSQLPLAIESLLKAQKADPIA
jgi:CheY-like chemotaxis protein